MIQYCVILYIILCLKAGAHTRGGFRSSPPPIVEKILNVFEEYNIFKNTIKECALSYKIVLPNFDARDAKIKIMQTQWKDVSVNPMIA